MISRILPLGPASRSQAGTLVREVLDHGERDRLVSNIVGHLPDAVTQPVLLRAYEYWRNVDTNLGLRIEKVSAPGSPDRQTAPRRIGRRPGATSAWSTSAGSGNRRWSS